MPYPAFRRRLRCAVRPSPRLPRTLSSRGAKPRAHDFVPPMVPRCPVKQSILWMHLIQTIDFTDQNNFIRRR